MWRGKKKKKNLICEEKKLNSNCDKTPTQIVTK